MVALPGNWDQLTLAQQAEFLAAASKEVNTAIEREKGNVTVNQLLADISKGQEAEQTLGHIANKINTRLKPENVSEPANVRAASAKAAGNSIVSAAKWAWNH